MYSDFGLGEYLDYLIPGFLDLKLNSAFNLQLLGNILQFIDYSLVVLVPDSADQPELRVLGDPREDFLPDAQLHSLVLFGAELSERHHQVRPREGQVWDSIH